ncbi:MAG: hypothetical protein ACI9WU_004531, partial [Myxococcota bacterium]
MRVSVSVFASALLSVLLLGCATAPPPNPIPPGTVLLTTAEHARLSRAAARVAELEHSLSTLAERLKQVEQRVGLATLDGTGLER